MAKRIFTPEELAWLERNPGYNLQREANRVAASIMRGGGRLKLIDWLDVIESAHNRCEYCREAKKLTIDHWIPLSKGGRNIKWNIRAACRRCNSRKGSRLHKACPPTEGVVRAGSFLRWLCPVDARRLTASEWETKYSAWLAQETAQQQADKDVEDAVKAFEIVDARLTRGLTYRVGIDKMGRPCVVRQPRKQGVTS